MSSKISTPKEPPFLVFDDTYLNHLNGTLLTVVESLGFPEKQEEALKSLVRKAIWEDAHSGWAFPVQREVWEDFRDSQMAKK